LVNPIQTTNLDLSESELSAELLAAAGPELQAACSAQAPLLPGQVQETSGFNLPCKKILHCNCLFLNEECAILVNIKT